MYVFVCVNFSSWKFSYLTCFWDNNDNHTNKYIRTYVYIYKYMCTFIYLRYIYIHTFRNIHIYVYNYIHIYIHMYTYIHIYIWYTIDGVSYLLSCHSCRSKKRAFGHVGSWELCEELAASPKHSKALVKPVLKLSGFACCDGAMRHDVTFEYQGGVSW